MSRADPVALEVMFIRLTDAAVLVEYDERQIWIPRSQLTYDGQLAELEHGEIMDIEIPEWLAYQRELI